jgi:3',5'-nucleoside bisphosphate phosphatase
MLIDLQIHSNYSDGYLTPTDLVKFIAEQGIRVAALTDHNTVRGVDEFKKACVKSRIKPIVGMELYAKFKNVHFNILWYNFDRRDPNLHKMLRDSQIRRKRQIRKILEKLTANGFKMDINKILDKQNHYVPVNYVIDCLVANKRNLQKIKRELGLRSPREDDIIRHYFRNKKEGILNESYINIERILKLKKKIGGQIVLCHPAKNSYIKIPLWLKLKKMGIDGIELFSPHHSVNAILYMQQFAREMNFITTGGSDFHRFEGRGQLIQCSWQYYKIDSQFLKGVKKIIG